MLIALTGRAGAGKDSAAGVLSATGPWHSIAFADELRSEVAEAWMIDPRALTERSTKELATDALAIGRCTSAKFMAWSAIRNHTGWEPRSPRTIMQWWGDYRRGQQSDYFVHPVRVWLHYNRLRKPAIDLVVTDVRMANEWAMLRAHGAHLVRVHRPDLPPMVADTAAHSSEQHTTLVAEYDVHNDGTLADLARQMQAITQRIAQRAAQAQAPQ